jgi:hypothetical protein
MKTEVVVFDKDSTLADTTPRASLYKGDDTDWVEYAKAGVNDLPTASCALARLLQRYLPVIVLTASPEEARYETETWLAAQGIRPTRLILAPSGTINHNAYKVKMMTALQLEYNVLLAVEDYWSLTFEYAALKPPVPALIVRSYDPATRELTR